MHELSCTSASFLKHPELFLICYEEIQRYYYSFQEIFLSLKHRTKIKVKRGSFFAVKYSLSCSLVLQKRLFIFLPAQHMAEYLA